MKNILLLLICLQLFGCATIYGNARNKGNGYDIISTPNPTALGNYGSVSIEYKDHSLLLRDELTALRNRFASEWAINNASLDIPLGGQVFIIINRISIGAANTNNFIYVVTKDGNEVSRRKGLDSIANVPSGSSRMWWNSSIVNIEEPFDKEITLYVIDDLHGGRDKFIIKKPMKKKYN